MMEKEMIDWDKSIETVDGKPAWIISMNYRWADEKLTVMQIEYSTFDAVGYYHKDGKPAFGSAEIRNRKTKREGWINIYRDNRTGETIYKTKEDAENSSTFKIATIEIEWEE